MDSHDHPGGERWIRAEADALLNDMPDMDILAAATELEAKAGVYDGGAQTACKIAAELRRRAAAGVRFWPPPKLLGA